MPDSSKSDDSHLSDAEKSIFYSMGSIMESVSFSIKEADQVLGRPKNVPQMPQKPQVPENVLQTFHGTLAAGQQGLIARGGGGYKYPITGPDAPVKARLLNSMLDDAGATDTSRQPLSHITTTDRAVYFRLPRGREEAIATRFNRIDVSLKREVMLLTKLFTASHYLDEKKGPNLGSKLTPRVQLLGERVGFPTTIETNDPDLIHALKKEGFYGEHIGEFNRSDMQPVADGLRFRASAPEIERILKAVHEVSGLHALVAPAPRALPNADRPALPFEQRAQRDSDDNIIGH